MAAGFSSFFDASCKLEDLKITLHKICRTQTPLEFHPSFTFAVRLTVFTFFLLLFSPLLTLTEVLLGTEGSWSAGDCSESTLKDDCKNRARECFNAFIQSVITF